MRPFEPLFRNPHLLTILGNFWPRKYDFSRISVENRLVQTDADTQVWFRPSSPQVDPVGEVVLLHGLEGGGDAGYMRSMAWDALKPASSRIASTCAPAAAPRRLCKTLYHARPDFGSAGVSGTDCRRKARPAGLSDRLLARRQCGAETRGRTGRDGSDLRASARSRRRSIWRRAPGDRRTATTVFTSAASSSA